MKRMSGRASWNMTGMETMAWSVHGVRFGTEAMVTFSVGVEVEFGLWLGIQGLGQVSELRLNEVCVRA